MLRTYGQMPASMPAGFFKAVHFPVLALLNTTTSDHRRIDGPGFDTRDLPLSIKYASKTEGGHFGAEVSGTLFEVTVDSDNNVTSGRGFLLDDENGRRHARLIHTGAMRGNSVDLADVKARIVEDFETGEWWIDFYDSSLAATTGVSTPAFAEAHAVVEPLTDEELVASYGPTDCMAPLVVQEPEFMLITVDGAPVAEIEITAALGGLVPFEDFYIPEADQPTKIVVDGDGRVYGHVSLWDQCHDGFQDQCIITPRPLDNYASFNKAGPLTKRGQVETGPIFLLGSHRKIGNREVTDVYGGIENIWADVRVTEGVHGPWMSGRVRPGVPDDMIYAARASRISGHWVNGKLKAIVSVGAEGYDVPGSGFAVDFNAPVSFATTDDGFELAASFPGCVEAEPVVPSTGSINESSFAPLGQGWLQWSGQVPSNGNIFIQTTTIPATSGTLTVTVPAAEAETPAVETADDLDAWQAETLADLLEADDES